MKYEVEIVNIGKSVESMLDAGDLIIFDKCPNEILEDVCIMHTRDQIKATIQIGDTVILGDKKYEITAIGDEAIHTLEEMGHCTFKFTGVDIVELPGQIVLKGNEKPIPLQIGDKICIG